MQFRFLRAFVALAFLLPALSAQAQLRSFDPSTCPTPTDMLRVRLVSGIELDLPPRNFLPSDYPEPEDSSLPLYGCPGNPMVVHDMSFAYAYAAKLKDRNAILPKYMPEQIRIYGHNGVEGILNRTINSIEEGKKSGWLSCVVFEGSLEYCTCPSDPDDPTYCLAPPPSTNKVLLENYTPYFRTLPGQYEEHNGVGMSGQCSVLARKDYQSCEARFVVMDGLSVRYTFNRRKVAETEILALDREIRAMIRAAIVSPE